MNPDDCFLLAIDKPVGWTSHDVVGYLRKGLSVKRIGHAGTLDPFATGLLLVAVGRTATRSLSEWMECDKTYRAVIRFGIITDTLDCTGTVVANCIVPDFDIVEKELPGFIGKQMQVPPAYSAIKVNGRKSYIAARKGTELVLEPRPVEFMKLDILDWAAPDLTIRIACSKGTYIRSFARDLAEAVGSVGSLQELRRERIGEVDVESAVSPQEAVDRLRTGELGKFVIRHWETLVSTKQ